MKIEINTGKYPVLFWFGISLIVLGIILMLTSCQTTKKKCIRKPYSGGTCLESEI